MKTFHRRLNYASDKNVLPKFKINTLVYCVVISRKTTLLTLITLFTIVRIYLTRENRCIEGRVYWVFIEFRGNIAVKVCSTVGSESTVRSRMCVEQICVIAEKCLDIVWGEVQVGTRTS